MRCRADIRLHHGRCLLALGRHADTGRALLESDRLLESSANPDETARQSLTEAMIKLYDAWDRPDQAAAWRAKLPATQPAETQP